MTRPRRTSALPAALLIAAATLPLTACAQASPPAPAAAEMTMPDRVATVASGCRVAAVLPARLAITAGRTEVRTRLQATPAGCAEYARFDVVAADGARTAQNLFVQGRAEPWQVGGPGRYVADFAWGYDEAKAGLTGASSAAMVVKYASSLSGWSAKRADGVVRLAVRVRAASATAVGPAVGRSVVFERRVGTAWRWAATVTVDAAGFARSAVRAPAPATWRAVLQPTEDAWGATSGAHRR